MKKELDYKKGKLAWISHLVIAGFSLDEYHQSSYYKQVAMRLIAEQKIKYDIYLHGGGGKKGRKR